MQAFIDVGTNTLKLQFASGEEDFSEGVAMSRVVRLGEGAGGYLQIPAMRRVMEALESFQREIEIRNADDVCLYATAAVREARNGREFLQEMEDRFGWNTEILSSKEEARLGFIGAGRLSSQEFTLIDIGGGSTEISVGRVVPERCRSFPIGALKQSREPKVLSDVFTNLPQRKGELVGIGGTIRMLAAIWRDVKTYSRKNVHATVIDMERLRELKERIEKMSMEEKRKLCAMDPERADIIEGGVQILVHLMERYETEKLTYSDCGLTEGFALKKWGKV